MNRKCQIAGLLMISNVWLISTVLAEPAKVTIKVDQPGAQVSPMLYGLFYEEIQNAGDGGLYAEMIENRSFEAFRNGNEFSGDTYYNRVRRGLLPDLSDPANVPCWKLQTATGEASMVLDQSAPLNDKNPTSLKLRLDKGSSARLINRGFKAAGLGLAKGTYHLSLYARAAKEFTGPLSIALERPNGERIASGKIEELSGEWKKLTLDLACAIDEPAGQLVLTFENPGEVWLDMVSLFPANTFKGRPNGLRADLAQMLVDLKPAFIRFPGGCFVEGLYDLDQAWRPLRTLGDVAQRPGIPGARWGYGSTDGLGYHEMLQMCEDMQAAPLLVVNCGLSHDDASIVRGGDPNTSWGGFVQEALDAIEYANGPTSTRWGAERAKAGHPEPFGLRYIEIGNENESFPEYPLHYAGFCKAIKEKYPEMTIISNSSKVEAEIVDEHYYTSTEQCMAQYQKQYDGYDRKGPRIFVGEFAIVAPPKDAPAGTEVKMNYLEAALGEAIFWMGAERNSDVVTMIAYAPLFCRLDSKMWPTNMIYFDQNRVFGTTSYYVWKMFSNNQGTNVLPTTTTGSQEMAYRSDKLKGTHPSLYVDATRQDSTGDVIIKAVNFLTQPQEATISIEGVDKIHAASEAWVLTADSPAAENSLDKPNAVVPVKQPVSAEKPVFTWSFAPLSASVLRIKTR